MNVDELNFAYKIRHALNEEVEQLPAATTDRLAAARKLALSRKKPDAPLRVAQRQLAGGAGTFESMAGSLLSSFLGSRLAVAIPLVALVVGLSGIYHEKEQQHIAEMAELDAAVLSDDLPLDAYLDQGFNAYLAKRPQ
jgi:hypothetical protein